MALLAAHSLTKRFGAFTALDSVSLEIDKGEVFGLLGPNGAGKSTLLRTWLGFLHPTTGTATFRDWDCHAHRVEVHRHLSYLPGDARLPRLMRADSLLQLYCQLRPGTSLAQARSIAERLELDLRRWVGLMSTGMRQKLALAIVMAADVPLLILDEPTANLDPTVRGQVLQMVIEARKQGRTVVLSSHVLSEIEDTCDRVGILRAGKLVHLESVSALVRQHRIRARLEGELDKPPAAIAAQIEIQREGQQLQIDTPGELSGVLKWLSTASLSDVHVQPIGLRAIYDRYHPGPSLEISGAER